LRLDLRGSAVEDCEFKNVDMTGAKLEGAEFRGSQSGKAMMVAAIDLKGRNCDPAQAMIFAGNHGFEDS